MNIERLSGDFNRGYTKAIQDIIKVFNYVQDDLKYNHKNITAKTAIDLLQCCLDNREKLREHNINNTDGFIRYNVIKKTFEFYEPNRREKE